MKRLLADLYTEEHYKDSLKNNPREKFCVAEHSRNGQIAWKFFDTYEEYKEWWIRSKMQLL